MINVSSNQKEKTRKVRDKILEDRVKRKLSDTKKQIFGFFSLSKEKEVVLEEKKENQPEEKELKEDYKEDVLDSLLTKALENFNEKNYSEA